MIRAAGRAARSRPGPQLLHVAQIVARADSSRALHREGRVDRAVAALEGSAGTALLAGPWSVTATTFVPIGGRADEYVHIAEYAWPDERGPELPWVIRDGRVNPAAGQVAADGTKLRELADTVTALVTAYWLLGDDRYSTRAVEVLEVWFCGPGTAMHPSLRHAVHVPGHDEAMTWGLARIHPLLRILEAVQLMESARVDDGVAHAVRTWCRVLLEWLLDSELFEAEIERGNNHATHACELALGLAVFVDDAGAREHALAAAELIRAQVDEDGSQPAELARTRPYFYSGYNALAMLRVADLAWCCDVDLFSAQDAPKRAVEALLPELVDPRRRDRASVESSDLDRHGDLLVRAAAAWPGNQRICDAMVESRILPGPEHRVWLDVGLDPGVTRVRSAS